MGSEAGFWEDGEHSQTTGQADTPPQKVLALSRPPRAQLCLVSPVPGKMPEKG